LGRTALSDIKLEAEDRGLAEQLERFADRLEQEGLEVELWYPVRKTAEVAEVGKWLLEIIVAKAVTDAVYPKIKQFLTDWFTATPATDRRPLNVRVRREGEEEPFDQFDLD